jgi:hypothetical protein
LASRSTSATRRTSTSSSEAAGAFARD